MLAKISFTQEPKEAIAYLQSKAKNYVPTFYYDEMMHEAHHRAFTVAKIAKTDLLKDIHQSLLKAQKNGLPFEQWKKNIKPTLQKKGWWGEVSVLDPKSGEIKDIYVGSRRLRTIFYTNMRVSYAVGRYNQQMSLKSAVFWRYSAIMDSKTRPKHKSMHGIVKHRDDPWWNKNYPPNGWGCRCKVQALTKKQMERKGFKETKAVLENIAEKDWSYHVGKTDNLSNMLKKKVESLPQEIKKVAMPTLKVSETITAIRIFMKSKTKNIHQEIGKIESIPAFLSDYTRDKQLEHHPELLEVEYGYIPIIIDAPDELFVRGKYKYYVKKIAGKKYMCIFKVVAGKNEIFLQSFRITKDKDIKREKAKKRDTR